MRSPGVIISALVHSVVIGVAIIAPLVASDILPAIQNPIAPYVRAFRPADIPLSVAPRTRAPAPRRGAPTVAPFGVSPEKPQPPLTDSPTVPFGTEGLTTAGLPADLGASDTLRPVPPPPPPPSPSSAVVKPVPVGGRIRTPTRIRYVVPVYPAIAQSAHVQGDVALEAIIGVDGTVQNVRVVHGVQLLTEAGIDAVRQWRYTPTLLNGVPVPVVMTVTVSFRLRD